MLSSLLQWLWSLLESLWIRLTAPTIHFGTNTTNDNSDIRVRVGRELAQGGFSTVFVATSNNNNTYALKRIHCGERDARGQCQREARVHRAVQHANCMSLLGMTFLETSTSSNNTTNYYGNTNKNNQYCYMLFPLYPLSLRGEINNRIFTTSNSSSIITASPPPPTSPPAPWSQLTVVQLVHGIVSGLHALHEAGYSHRDVKPENVLLRPNTTNTTTTNFHYTPVLMDFGSAGPVSQTLLSRRDVSLAMDTAATHTTMPYRPPELFIGGLTLRGPNNNNDTNSNNNDDSDLDYRKVDVWSLGCLLFAIMFGTSPAECEFPQQQQQQLPGSNSSSTTTNLCIRIIPCTQLSVLKDVPVPPRNSRAAHWYPSPVLWQLLRDCLQHDRHARPTLPMIMERLENMAQDMGGTCNHNNSNAIPMVRTTSLASRGSTHSRYLDSFVDDHENEEGVALV